MENAWPQSLPLSRGLWARLADVAADASIALLTGLELRWQRWQLDRRRDSEQRALRALSPTVLRDIGAPPEWINEAHQWRERRDLALGAFLRNM